jgi:hypothetical protein
MIPEKEDVVELVEEIAIVEAGDLEPITIGEITELTSGSVKTGGDHGNIVWGS